MPYSSANEEAFAEKIIIAVETHSTLNAINNKQRQLKKVSLVSLALVLTLFACTNSDDSSLDHGAENAAPETNEVSTEDQELYDLIAEKDSLLF